MAGNRNGLAGRNKICGGRQGSHPLLREWQCIVLRRAAGPKTARAMESRNTTVHPRPYRCAITRSPCAATS